MNISSAIITTSKADNAEVIRQINSIEGCDVPIHEGQKLVVAIEADNIGAETKIMKLIENIEGVLSVKLAFSYSEQELEKEMQKVMESEDFPEWLNKDTNAKEISYSGRLKM